MLWLILCFLGVMVWLAPKYLRYRRMQKLLQSIPTLDSSILSSLFALYRVLTWKPLKVKLLTAFKRVYWKQGCSVHWNLHQPVFIAGRPEYVEAILSRDMKKSLVYESMKALLGNGLLTSTGDLWKRHRKLLNPAFHTRLLDEFIPIMNKKAQTLVKVLSERSHNDTWVDIFPLCERCSFDILCETLMGVEIGSHHGSYAEFLEAMNEIHKYFLTRTLNPLHRFNFLYYRTAEGKQFLKYLNTLNSFTKQAFDKRKEILRDECKLCQASENDSKERISGKNSLKPVPLMDTLLHFHMHEKLLTEQEVVDEINTFMFAGYETTALSMTWTFYLLGCHPEVQEKVQEELTTIFASNKERPATNNDIKMMKYLDCVIKESLRICPVIPSIGRFSGEDIPIDKDLVIPSGSECLIPVYSIFHDKKEFPRPERFIPERFLPECSQKPPAFSYIPFGAGPRTCIGQRYAMNEVKIILSSVLRCFSIRSLDYQDKIILEYQSITFKPKCPIRISFKLRSMD